MAGFGSGSSMRKPQTFDAVSVLSRLETDESLPDDDPRTRNGGLNPARQQDIPQIQFYAQARQSGALSDKAWEKLIQRNPNAATLFSAVGVNPEVSAQKQRQQVLGQYFSPEREGVTNLGPMPESDEQMVSVQQATPVAAKADMQGAVLSLLSKGDIAGATALAGFQGKGGKEEKEFEGEPRITKTKDGKYIMERFHIPSKRYIQIQSEGSPLPPENILTVVDTSGNQQQIAAPRGSVTAPLGTGKNVYDDQTKAIAKEVDASGIPAMDSAFEGLSGKINKYGKNLPGVGGAKNLGGPVLGTVADFFKTDEGKEVSNFVKVIFNTQLKTQSGSAVTVPEEIRKRLELALTPSRNAQDFITVFNNQLVPWYEKTRKNIVGGYNPTAVKNYEERSGIKLTESPVKKQTAAPSGWNSDKEKRYQELLRKRNGS